MTTTKQLFEDLNRDHLNILGCGESILRTAKEEIERRDREILDLKLQLETINKPKSS